MTLVDWVAFGAPWRLSYRFVANEFQKAQESGFFGVRLPPPLFSIYEVLAGPGGLLVASPILVAAAWGLDSKRTFRYSQIGAAAWIVSSIREPTGMDNLWMGKPLVSARLPSCNSMVSVPGQRFC